jgi:hypothetical protein
MKPIHPTELYSLEQYHAVRAEFRDRVIQHKKHRHVALGPNATLYFEDRLTVQYQVQEMLRIERIFEPEAIAEELDAYNPLIPNGRNLKATFMIEFPDIDERRVALRALNGIEKTLYAQVSEHPAVAAIADEDLERTDADKTSAVHFVRFEFSDDMVASLRSGSPLAFGTNLPAYRHETTVAEAARQSLLQDFA